MHTHALCNNEFILQLLRLPYWISAVVILQCGLLQLGYWVFCQLHSWLNRSAVMS